MKRVKLVVLLLVSVALAKNSFADEGKGSAVIENRVRLNLGYTYITGQSGFAIGGFALDEMSAGLDYTRTFTENLELGVSATRVFLASGSEIYVFGLTPAYAITHNRTHLYGGFLLGAIYFSESVYDFNGQPVSLSTTRFAFGPRAGIDYQIIDSIFAHASMEYVKAFGVQDKLGALTLQAGVGYAW